MGECENLTNINLIGLTKLEQINNLFAVECKNLTNINLIGLTELKMIGTNFAEQCTNLEEIKLIELTKLEWIGADFLSGSTDNLESIYFTGNSRYTKDRIIKLINNK